MQKVEVCPWPILKGNKLLLLGYINYLVANRGIILSEISLLIDILSSSTYYYKCLHVWYWQDPLFSELT